MPFGLIPSSNRLGISNTAPPNASSFASAVLRLPQNVPIYQGQLVHSTISKIGVPAAAEWCGQLDNEFGNNTAIREISPVETAFSCRNLNDSPTYDFLWHRSAYSNQIYYVNNEPEFRNQLGTQDLCNPEGCWNKTTNDIDSSMSPFFPDPLTQFWEEAPEAPVFNYNCSPTSGTLRRPRADALAFVYLRLRRETAQLGRNHVVLPPSAAYTKFYLSNDPYWQTFYDKVRNGVTIGSASEPGITPAEMKVLHIHRYSGDPIEWGLTPVTSVAVDAVTIRQGADWYRNRYNSGQALPLDMLLSEMGHDWKIDTGLRWAGGWPGFATGLTWWNTWLCWLTRTGPWECNLQGWDSGQHTIHACIHEPMRDPYVAQGSPNGARNQWYFNSDAWSTYVYYDAPVIRIDALLSETTFHIFQNSFTAIETSVNWGERTWRRTPFGACYTVWSQVGPDPVAQSLSQGWVESRQSGMIGNSDTSVSLPQGWSTVYFPVIKDVRAFQAGTQVSIRWIRPSDGAVHDRGFMDMRDFSDGSVVSHEGYNQYVYTAMIYPVVCYASVPRTVSVRLSRNVSGNRMWLGRPIVMPGACSWFIDH